MKKLQWEILVPIFRNSFILRGLGMAIGLPFGVLALVILFLSKGDIMGTDAKYALALIGFILGLSFIVTIMVYGSYYAAGFILDEIGITNYTQEKQAKKNKAISRLAITLGLLRGNLAAVGTGLISESRQIMQINWDGVRKVFYYPKNNTIIVKGGFAEKIWVFCLKENYEEVSDFIRGHI